MAKPVYSPTIVMSKAWRAAKQRARHEGVNPRQLLPQALREAAADQRRVVDEILAMRARIQATLDEIRFSQSELGRKQAQRRMAALDAELETAIRTARAKTAALLKPNREAAA